MRSKLLLLALSLSSFVCASQTVRTPQFTNEYVKCWKTEIAPCEPLKMHRHDRPRTVVALKGGVLKRVTDKGEESYLVFETGKAYWLEADPLGELHGDINISNETIEVMVIEMVE
jgi:hypothetical protein